MGGAAPWIRWKSQGTAGGWATPPKDPRITLGGSPRVMPVKLPQLWEDLVKFACGKEVSFTITEGGQVQVQSLVTEAEETCSLSFTTENRARAKLASPLNDPDGSVGLEHPAAFQLFQFVVSDFTMGHDWRKAIQCRHGIMRMT